MIIIDYSGIAISNIIAQKLEIREDIIRHMILNSIRMYNVKFRAKYGQVVIATDSSSWRKEVFPQYKFKRKAGREESTLDWNEVFRITNSILTDLRENFPYKVIHVDRCEADDIIGVLANYTQEFGKHEDVMIVSADKDFIQLQVNKNVRQFSTMTKKFLDNPNPQEFLREHILCGDSGDGVPNILSNDNTFVEGIRQSPMTKKKIDLYSDTSKMEEEVYRNYCRNKMLIDLSCTPKELQEEIIERYESDQIAHKSKVLNYLIKNKCRLLVECVGEFL